MKSMRTSQFTNWRDTGEDGVVVDVLPASQLEEDGFQNVFDLHEGLAGYEAKCRPVATARAH